MPNLRVGFQLVIGFLTLINTSFATTPSNNIATSLKENEGYRCETRVYSRESLIESALLASQRLFQDIIPNSNVVDTSFPKAYYGPIDFKQEKLFLWPLQERGLSSDEAETDFVILGNSLKQIVGVVWGQERRHVKCIKEDDLSDMYGTENVAGYRCPLEFHSIEIIRYQIVNARSRSSGRLPFLQATLKSLVGLQLYHGINKAWGLSITGKKHRQVTTSIVLDENFSFIGVIHLRKGKYIKCLVTAKNKITPKFVGDAILQQAVSIDQECLDIFLCGSKFISSKQVLIAASAAHRDFVWRRNNPTKPAIPLRFDGSPANVELYLWPMKFDDEGKYVDPIKYNRREKYHVLIDYFSDVHGLIMREFPNQIHACRRMMYPKDLIPGSSIRSNEVHRDKRIKIT